MEEAGSLGRFERLAELLGPPVAASLDLLRRGRVLGQLFAPNAGLDDPRLLVAQSVPLGLDLEGPLLQRLAPRLVLLAYLVQADALRLDCLERLLELALAPVEGSQPVVELRAGL